MSDELNNSNADKVLPVLQVENIEILNLLGRGGMSEVYRARQKDLDQIVAVKIIHGIETGSEERIQRFKNEARLTSSLEHPNVVKILYFGISKEGLPYLLMEYVEGKSLAELFAEKGTLSLQLFKDIFIPILDALELAHAKGLVHRDIKPSNIMLCQDDSGQVIPKLVDFGIAKLVASSKELSLHLTKTGMILGSPPYMSPEQCAGKDVDGRSDIYSLACVMYEFVSGQPPFVGSSQLDVMHKHLVEPPPTVAILRAKVFLGKKLAEAIIWGLAKDLNLRPKSAAVLKAQLNNLLDKAALTKSIKIKADNSQRSILPLQISAAIFTVALVGFILTIIKSRSSSRVMIEHLRPPELTAERLLQIKAERKLGKEALKNADKLLFFDKDEAAIASYNIAISKLINENNEHSQELYDAFAGLGCCIREFSKKTHGGKVSDADNQVAIGYFDKAILEAKANRNQESYFQACGFKLTAIFDSPKVGQLACGQLLDDAASFLPASSSALIRLRIKVVEKLLSDKTCPVDNVLKMAQETAQLVRVHHTVDCFLDFEARLSVALVLARRFGAEKALPIAREIADKILQSTRVKPDERAVVISDICLIYSELRRPDLYEQFMARVPVELYDPYRVGRFYRLLAQNYAKKKNYEKAIRYFKLAQKYYCTCYKKPAELEYVEVSAQLADLYRSTGQSKLARECEKKIQVAEQEFASRDPEAQQNLQR